MMKPMQISLRQGERIYVNGAVLRVDRKVTIELLNDVTFLLENHVLQVEDTTTPLRQLYFAAQAMLMDPANKRAAGALFLDLSANIRRVHSRPEILEGIEQATERVIADRPFDALRILRKLFPLEDEIMGRLSQILRPKSTRAA